MKKLLSLIALLWVCLPHATAQSTPPVRFDAAAWQRQVVKRDLSQPARKPAASRLTKALWAGAIGCGAADSLTTEWRKRQGYREGNPLLGGSPARRQGISWGVRGGIMALLYRLRHSNPRAVRVGLGALTGWGCGAAVWNASR
jgi:hypothetical protein